MKQFFLSLVICFLSLTVACQAQGVSVGKVVDTNGTPIEFANVVFQTKDSVYVAGCITDIYGDYTLHTTESMSNLILKVSCLGYIGQTYNLPAPSVVKLSPDTLLLGEVIINGKQKYIKNINRGISIRVSETPLANLPTADSAIRQMPMIDGASEKIQVLGKGTPEIYINNRRIQSYEELKQLSASDVKSVEVITNPGVKYGADVKSVLVIHTQKRNLGMAGVLSYSQTFSDVVKEYGNADVSYLCKNGLGLYASSYLSHGGYNRERTYREIFNDNLAETVTQGRYKNVNLVLNAKIGGSYDFSSNNSIGVRYEFNRTPYNTLKFKTGATSAFESSIEQIEAIEKLTMPSYQHYLNSYGVFKFGKKDNMDLSIDADYLGGASVIGMNTSEHKDEIEVKNVQNQTQSDYDVFAARVDYGYMVKKIQLEAGTNYSFTNNTGRFKLLKSEGSDMSENSLDKERQNLFACYARGNYALSNNWNISAGMRAEFLNFKYFSNNVLVKEQSKSYANYLPELSVSYKTKKYSIDVDYSETIRRPSYGLLNNNYTYVTHTSWETGNPLLKPSLEKSVSLRISSGQTIFSAIYAREEHSINTTYSYLPEQKVNLRQNVNLPNYNVFLFVLSHSLNLNFWHPTFKGLLFVQNLEYGNPVERYKKPFGKIDINNRVDLPYNIYAYINWSWLSNGNQNTSFLKERSNLNIMLNKNYKKWSFTFTLDNILGTWRDYNIISTNGVLYSENRKGVFSGILSVSYKFNKKRTYKGNGAVAGERGRL